MKKKSGPAPKGETARTERLPAIRVEPDEAEHVKAVVKARQSTYAEEARRAFRRDGLLPNNDDDGEE